MATNNVGVCHSGTHVGPCMGEVTPVAETCSTPEESNEIRDLGQMLE